MTGLRYWDSSCFIAWFNEEAERVEACEGVVQEARAGDIRILTSAITLTEVIKPAKTGTLAVYRNKDEDINRFFEQPFVVVRNADRAVCEEARRLIWQHRHLNRNDAIHVATAMLTGNVLALDTFDDDMLRIDGIGNPPLKIGRPDVPFQPQLEEP
ncbi:MAG: PIN domain-containing protein [Coriobacteriia bacterium]|nr:PIN domain-containing protein [Coriobacteriia bacterium]